MIHKTAFQNVRNRVVTILLAMAMITLIAIPTLAAETKSFPDVPAGKWFTVAVTYCAQKGYVSGYDDGTFRPDKRLTRAEMAAIMNKKLGLQESAANTFSDVPSGKWFTEPILHCVKAGVMSGLSTKTFGTNETLTREQGAVVLAKAFGVSKVSGRTTFADDASISSWAVESVKAMAAKGLISGTGNNKFGPKDPLTRAQMCQIIWAAEQKTNSNPAPAPSGTTAPSSTVTSAPSSSTTPTPSETQKPSNSIIPTTTDKDETIRVGSVVNTTTKETWSALLQKYTAQAGQNNVKRIYVDNDSNQELIIFGDRGAGNEKVITYHNGTVSELPLNGAAIAYVPKGNAVMIGEYEDGTYYLSIYTISNGKWTRKVEGSFQDPPGGPQKDANGDDVYTNYKWNGKSVSEEVFYLGLIGSIDVTKLETIEK